MLQASQQNGMGRREKGKEGGSSNSLVKKQQANNISIM